jgi:putative DNA primase/helicase
MNSDSIKHDQRFSAAHPCPICGGHDRDKRGKGARCFGYMSGNGNHAHCTRDEHAGQLAQNTTSETYPHLMEGPCKCGVTHREARSQPDRGVIVATYPYLDHSGKLLFEAVRYMPKRFSQRRPDGAGGWKWNLVGIQRVPYRLPELLAAPPDQVVLIPEGEKDVDNLRALGFVATCNPCGAGKWAAIAPIAAPILRGRQVVVLPDSDDHGQGQKHADQVVDSCRAAGAKVCQLPMPEGFKDVSDWLAAGGTAQELRETIVAALNAPLVATRTQVTRLTDVKAVRVDWLWKHRIPYSAVTVFDGDPGLGKSTLTLDIAARLTTGRAIPTDGEPLTVGNVLMLADEDSPGATIRPRFEAAAGDCNRLLLLEGADGVDYVSFPSSADAIIERIRADGITLFIIDPLMAHLDDNIDAHKDASMRRVMRSLARMAAETQCAVVAVRHFTKQTGVGALHRGGGSIGISGAARSVLAIAPDADDPEGARGSMRLVAPIKSNLCKKAAAVSLRIIEAEGQMPRLEWLGETDADFEANLQRLALQTFTKGAPKAAEAEAILREILANGPVDAVEGKDEVKRRGVTEATFRRAYQALKVDSRKCGKGWRWRLPTPTPQGDQAGTPSE